MTNEIEMILTTVAEYKASNPDCTGEFEDIHGDIMPDDAEITIFGDEYCVGHYDGNQTFMSLI